MRTRAALNVAYSAWTDELTHDGRVALDHDLMSAADQAELARQDRVAEAASVPEWA